MTDAATLLQRHAPRLVYDSLEPYFADSAQIFTDAPTNALKAGDGSVIARPSQLSLAFLGRTAYADGRPAAASDAIGDGTRDYAAHAAAMHANVRLANRIHARARRDSRGDLWLQYWFFYYYNAFELIGPLLSAGNHEGDWEMIQIQLGADERPVRVAYAQHHGGQLAPWSAVQKAPSSADTPLVYVARGSHASYLNAGEHFTGVWFDHADGRGPKIDPALIMLGDGGPAWAVWPGTWGDTKATPGVAIDASSPVGPGHHGQWGDPLDLVRRTGPTPALAQERATPPASPPPAPHVSASRDGDGVRLAFQTTVTAPLQLLVGVRAAGSAQPARTLVVPIDGASGVLTLPPDVGDGPLQIGASVAGAAGQASASALTSVSAG